ncbi:hypothetical protein [Wenyingzhuangia sp. IMCC45574]
MPIVNLFLSGTQKKNRGHLANIVKIARSNGKLNRDEIRLIKKIKKELNVNDVAFRKIIRNPELYPINPPANYEERIERLYALCRMLLIDKESFELSLRMLKKLAVGLGFPLQTHEVVVDTAVALSHQDTDFDTFALEVRKVNVIA